MSHIYLWNNRILKMKDVDKELEKIGTSRQNFSSKEFVALGLSILLLLGVLGYVIHDKKHHKTEIKNNTIEMSMYNSMQQSR